MAGYTFHCDKTLLTVAMDHDAHMEHPFRTSRPANNVRAMESRMRAINGEWKLNYL
jgi:hypothetical protein